MIAISHRLTRAVLIPLCVGLLVSCATTGRRASVNTEQQYIAGDYEAAAQALDQDLGLYDPETGEYAKVVPAPGLVLLQLDAAETWRLAGNYERSVQHYHAVEDLFKDKDTEGVGVAVTENIGAVIINDTIMSYTPTPVERVLVNYYNALNFLAMGDAANARIEFNRAGERAERALARYAFNPDDEDASTAISKYYPEMAGSVYSDFENPAVQYVTALFYQAEGETSKARDTMKQARVKIGIGKHPVVEDDFNSLDKGNRSLTADGNHVWVLVEAGRSAYLKEKRVDLPLPGPSGGVVLVSIALPVVVNTPSNFNAGAARLNGSVLQFAPIADSSRLIRTELSKRFPAMMTRSLIAAAAKAVLQDQAAEYAGVWGNLAATAFTAVTTKADTRMWQMIPNQWLLAKAPLNGNGQLELTWGAGGSEIIELSGDSSWLVVLKQPSPAAKPGITKIRI